MVSVWPWLSRHCHDTPNLLFGEVGLSEAPPPASMLTLGFTRSHKQSGRMAGDGDPQCPGAKLASPGLAAHSFLQPQASSDSPLLTHTHFASLPDSGDISIPYCGTASPGAPPKPS